MITYKTFHTLCWRNGLVPCSAPPSSKNAREATPLETVLSTKPAQGRLTPLGVGLPWYFTFRCREWLRSGH